MADDQYFQYFNGNNYKQFYKRQKGNCDLANW